MERWTDPRVQWHRGTDSLRHYQYLVNGAELLTRWEPAPFEFSPTDCFKLADDFWIWQPGVGGIRFNAADPSVTAFPSDTVDPAWFEHLIERSWMPAVYESARTKRGSHWPRASVDDASRAPARTAARRHGISHLECMIDPNSSILPVDASARIPVGHRRLSRLWRLVAVPARSHGPRARRR